MVDEAGGLDGTGRIVVPAGALSLATPLVVPVTTTSSIAALRATTLRNLTGVFSLGGAAAVEDPPCPPVLDPDSYRRGAACVRGDGFGGVMGLSGTLGIALVVDFATLPLSLGGARIGQGGTTDQGLSFFYEPAPWTLGIGQVHFLSTFRETLTVTTPGGATLTVRHTSTGTVTRASTGRADATASRLSLVTPTYLGALGNHLPIFTRLTIELVPEPGSFALLAGGCLLLAGTRRRRRR